MVRRFSYTPRSSPSNTARISHNASQAEAHAAGDIDWDVSVDSTIVRAHQHAACARTDPPSALASKGAGPGEHQGETPWQSLVARLVKVMVEARALAARGAGSPARST
ncbi:hypothetical protein [Kitasatospora sp. NPDC091207]|uniref:hypothetical protein n=1 Tax=Kitasatospora sp. NPDC091207 TaxID=3364083 RepID=UPI00381BD88B